MGTEVFIRYSGLIVASYLTFRHRLGRSRLLVQLFSFLAAVGFVAVTAVDPYSGAIASPYFTVTVSNISQFPAQGLTSAASYANSFSRDGYTAAAPSAGSVGWRPPAAAIPDPGSAQAIAATLVAARGWSFDEFSCLVDLWKKESGWRVNAFNASSGAYGIPQALPGNKMASAGADWDTNPETQIIWGLGYVSGRYQTPCGAWQHSQSVGWY